MRKTLLYLLLLAILGIGVYFFLFNNKENFFASDEAGFTIRDTGAIGKLYIAGPDGTAVTVVRTDSGWMVNNEYRAMPSTVNIVLKTLVKQAAQYPVPASMHNTVVTALAGNKITVEVYNRQGDKMRSFFVGGETKDMNGTYMLIDGAKKPYVVNVPGFTGYLSPNYPYRMSNWRDRTVFDVPADQVKSISVQYPDYPLNSFVVKQDGNKIAVDGDPTIISNKQLNERRVHVYLKYFERISCEGYLVGIPDMDTMLRVMPKYCTVELTSIQGKRQHVDIYWTPLTKRSKNLTTPDANVPDNQYDADRFFAVMNNYKDTAIVQSNIFNKIFRKGYEFYEADAQYEENKNPRTHQIRYDLMKPKDKK